MSTTIAMSCQMNTTGDQTSCASTTCEMTGSEIIITL